MFKKTLALLAATAVLAVGMGTVALAADECQHENIKTKTVEATCTAEGSYVKYCDDCKATLESKTLPKADHDFKVISSEEATCTKAGTETKRCQNEKCGATVTETTGKADHKYVIVMAEIATCTKAGKTAGEVCEVCGDVKTAPVVIPALGHQFGEPVTVVEPTCQRTGLEVKTCAACGATEQKKLTKADHDLVLAEEGYAATCTKDGKEDSLKCKNCDYTEGGATITKLGHGRWVEVPKKESTCTEAGHEGGLWCEICHDYKPGNEPRELPIAKHKWVDDQIVTEPTCSEAGQKAVHCENCGKQTWKSIPATGKHDYVVNEKLSKPATCTEEGDVYVECSVCGDHKYEHPAATGHALFKTLYQEAKCEQTGIIMTTCRYCDLAPTYEYIDAIAHKNKVEIKAVAATCTTKGTEAGWYCPDCKKYSKTGNYGEFTETSLAETNALKHNLEKKPYLTEDANCTYPETKYYRCTREGCEYIEVKVTDGSTPDKSKHDYEEVKAVAATCTTAGHNAYKYCTICEKKSGYKEIPATGHVNLEIKAVVAPTCTETGKSTSAVCKDCGETVVPATVIEALGHNYVVDEKQSTPALTVEVCSRCGDVRKTEHEVECKHEWKVVEEYTYAPTCTKPGQNAAYCAKCDEWKIETVAALGHSMIVTTKAIAPTCTDNGRTEGSVCQNCDLVIKSEVLPRLGHKAYYVEAVAPTCVKDGHSALYACENCQIALTEYDVYMAKGEHTPVYGYNSDVHFMACKDCGEILLSGSHELVTTVSGGKVHTACKWCAYETVKSIFAK